jgi:hypothetical protein
LNVGDPGSPGDRLKVSFFSGGARRFSTGGGGGADALGGGGGGGTNALGGGGGGWKRFSGGRSRSFRSRSFFFFSSSDCAWAPWIRPTRSATMMPAVPKARSSAALRLHWRAVDMMLNGPK